MNRKNFIMTPILFLLSSIVQAEDTLEWGVATPAEVYACDVREGSSAEKDTMNFVEDWKEWALENGAFSKYTAQLMRPITHNGTG